MTASTPHAAPAGTWTPNTWRDQPIRQVPTYPDLAKLDEMERRIGKYPPLVFAGEARRLQGTPGTGRRGQGVRAAGRRLRRKLRRFHRQHHPRHLPRAAADGRRADLRRLPAGGEDGPHGRPVRQAALLGHRNPGRRHPAVSYRGDIINGPDFTPEARIPDPARMEFGYFQSASTLNLLRAFASGGYADLHEVHRWNLGFVERSPLADRYRDLAARIDETLSFMAACGMTSDTTRDLRETDFYVSHEALLLPYEQALTRVDSHHRRLVRLLGAFPVDRRPHAPARRRACGIPARGEEPDRHEGRPDAGAGRPAAHARGAEPDERGGPHHADQPHGRRQGGREAAAAGARGASAPATRWSGCAIRCTATRSPPSPS